MKWQNRNKLHISHLTKGKEHEINYNNNRINYNNNRNSLSLLTIYKVKITNLLRPRIRKCFKINVIAQSMYLMIMKPIKTSLIMLTPTTTK